MKRIAKGMRLVLEGERKRLEHTFSRPSSPVASPELRDSARLAAHFRTRTAPNFFVSAARKDALVAAFRERFRAVEDAVIADADALCANRFCFLGERHVDLGPVIDWHCDFLSGARWSRRVYHKLVERLGRRTGADIKVPWELSRFQHVPALGKAYWLTDDEKYVRAFAGHVRHWIEGNPPGFGVNWACTMDVAIRVANWIWGWYFFKDSSSLDDRFVNAFVASIAQHGNHIMRNLEVLSFEGKQYKNNHYLSDVVGLVYLGILFPELEGADAWRSTGLRALEEEMNLQVCDDGVSFEMSIPYHRLAVELFLYPAMLCRLNGVELSQAYWHKLERMLEFTACYTKPDGLAPQMGDADDGRLHILSNYSNWERRDHRYLLAIGGELFGRDDFRERAGGNNEDLFWLTACHGNLGKTEEVPGPPRRAIDCSQAFASSGFYAMRSNDHSMLITATGVGTGGLGGHKHNDVLSFELCAGGESFIVDPGSFAYTAQPALRNLFRSTGYHNTVQVDDHEQNRLNEAALFLMREEAHPHVREWRAETTHDYFDGEHYGYCRFPGTLVHRRRIYFDKQELFWIVGDELKPRGGESAAPARSDAHVFKQYFHFAPVNVARITDAFALPEAVAARIESVFGVERESLGRPVVVRATAPSGNSLVLVSFYPEGLDVDIAPQWISPSYGVKEEASVLTLRKQGETVEFLTVLFLEQGT